MSGNFRLSYTTISGLFRPSCPPHYFQKYPSFMFHHLSPVLAGCKVFDPGLFLETETQQYVLLGTTISAH